MSAIDYEAESAKRLNWLDITGGGAKDSLTVLDYFAGKAMEGLVMHTPFDRVVDPERYAWQAFQFAEAMLAERSKRYTPQNVLKGVTGKTYG